MIETNIIPRRSEPHIGHIFEFSHLERGNTSYKRREGPEDQNLIET